MNLILASAFGAAIFAMYPIIVAHANDHAPEGTSIQVSGGLLLVFGLGSIIGPLMAGVMMSVVGALGLFVTTVAAHVLMILYTVWRILQRAAVAEEDKGAFQIILSAKTTTPETATLATGEEDNETLEEAFEAEDAADLADSEVDTPAHDDRQRPKD